MPDKAYLGFKRLDTLHQYAAFFVTRAKVNTNVRRLYSKPVDKSTGVMSDQTVVLIGFYFKKDYPGKLCRVKYFDIESGERFVFLRTGLISESEKGAGVPASFQWCRFT